MKATKRTKPESVPAADPDESFDQEVEADIEQFLAGQSEQAIVTIYRVGKPGERDGFLDNMSIGALTGAGPEQVIRDTYGAGHYRLKLRAPDRRGILKYAGMRTVTIAALAPSSSGNGRHAQGPEDFWREEANRSHQLLLAAINAGKPQQLDLAGLAALITAVTGGGKQSDLLGVVQAFTTLKQSAEPRDGLEQIQKALELARSINGAPAPAAPGEDDSSWPGLIKSALTVFTGAGAGSRRPALPPAEDPRAGDDPDEEGPQTSEDMMRQWLLGQIQFLKTKAIANKPVDFWIKYTIDNADEIGNQAIFAALKGGATFEHLLAFDPEIAQNPILRVWFQQFYDALKRSLSPPAPYPWIVGNVPNIASDASSGPGGQPESTGGPGGVEPRKPTGN